MGDIAGTTTDASGLNHIFLYADEFGGMVSVTNGIVNPPPDTTPLIPWGINSQRVIVGTISTVQAPFMLIPIAP